MNPEKKKKIRILLYFIYLGLLFSFLFILNIGLKYGFIVRSEKLITNLMIIVLTTLAILCAFISYFFQTEKEKQTLSKQPENPILSALVSTFGEQIKTEKLNKKMPEWEAWLLAIIGVIIGFLILTFIVYLIYGRK